MNRISEQVMSVGNDIAQALLKNGHADAIQRLELFVVNELAMVCAAIERGVEAAQKPDITFPNIALQLNRELGKTEAMFLVLEANSYSNIRQVVGKIMQPLIDKAQKICQDEIRFFYDPEKKSYNEADFTTPSFTDKLPFENTAPMPLSEMPPLAYDDFFIKDSDSENGTYMTSLSNWETEDDAKTLANLLARIDWIHFPNLHRELLSVPNVETLPTHMDEAHDIPIFMNCQIIIKDGEDPKLMMMAQFGDDGLTERYYDVNIPLSDNEKNILRDKVAEYELEAPVVVKVTNVNLANNGKKISSYER